MFRNCATVGSGPRWNRDSKQLVSDQTSFFRCLPAIALLIGALFLFAAPSVSATLTGLSLSVDGIAVPITPPFTSANGQYTASVPHDTTSVSVTPTWTATGAYAQVGSLRLGESFLTNIITSTITVSTSGTSTSVNLASSGDTLVWATLFYADGTATDYSITVSRLQPPAAPTGLTVTAGDAELRLAWTAPVDAIAGYDVAYTSAPKAGPGAVADTAAASGINPSVAWVLTRYNPSSSATSWTISDLTNNTDYRVRVRAIGLNFLESPWTFATGKPKTATVTPPAAPTGLTVTAGNTDLFLEWTAPVDAIAGYDVHFTSAPKTGSGAVADTAAMSGQAVPGSDPSVGWVETYFAPSSSATSWTISYLHDNTAYRVRVRAVTMDYLESPWAFATGTTGTPQTAPAVPRQTLTGLSLSVNGTAVPITHTSTSADDQIRSYTASVPHDTTSVSITPTWTATGTEVQVGSTTPGRNNVITDAIIVPTSGTSNSVNLAASGDTLVWAALFYADSTANTDYEITVSKLQPPTAQIEIPAQTLPTIRMSASPNPVDEGSSVTVTLTLSEAAASQVVIPVTLTNVWAESDDYGPLASITIPAGATTGTGTITTAHDPDAEHETFRLVLGAPPAGYAMPASQVQIMIRDDEAGAGAAPIAHAIHDNQTPALSVFGAIVDEGTGVAREGFRVKVKNLTTKASASEITSVETADGYSVTLLDLANARATRVGDVLEISADSPDPRMGVEPVRHIVTVDDVKRGTIQLEALIAYEIPAGTELLRNYPNPFNPETWIPYRLAKDADVSLTIYDANGALVRTIDMGHQSAAVYESRAKAIYWDGRNHFGEQVASGVYFYSLSAGDFSATRKMVILK